MWSGLSLAAETLKTRSTPTVDEMLGALYCGFWSWMISALTISGNATKRPSDVTSFTTQVEFRMYRNSARSSRRPKSGATMNTETTRHTHIGCGPRPKNPPARNLYMTAADRNACAPNARLKTPDVL